MATAPTHSLTALRKLEDHLTCPVCLVAYTDPRVLQCMHTFCRKCLEKLTKRGTQGIVFVECPTCRKKTEFTAIEELQRAFYLESLFEIKRDLEASHGSGTSEKHVKCLTHNVAVESYCKTCKQFLCNLCVYGEHKDHSFDDIALVSSEEVADMKLKLKALNSNVLSVEKAMNDIDIKVCGAHDEEKCIQNELQESCKQAHLVIEKREKDLIKQLRQMTEQKLQNLSVRKEQLQLVSSELKSCSEAVKESLQIESPTELLRMKHTLTPMIDDITLHLNQVTTHASSKQANNIAFFADKSTIESLRSYGKVYVKLPDGEKCLVQGDGLTRAKVGEVAEVQLSLYDKHNQEIKIGSVAHTISAELYSSAKSSLFKCSIEDFAENKCTVRYEPIMKGAHKLDIEVCGCLVKGSPFCVSVKASLAHIGPDPLLVIPGLSQPWGIVTDKKGRLCVAVSGRKEVVMLNSYSGEKISTVVKRNLLKNTLEEPAGLTLDEDQKLLIADFRLSTIQRVTLSGQVLQEIGSSGYKAVEFTYPSSLAINPINNKIYVTEWKENNRVQILNNDLTHYRTFGCTGSELGQFLCPSGLAFDRKGNVYVADSNNARIQVFSCDGDYLSDFGKRGQKEGKLGLPMGLCMDLTSDVLYVTDVHNHRVSLFKTDGQFLRCFGSFGSGPGQFNKPQGIAVDEHRFVYVSDTLNDRVQVF